MRHRNCWSAARWVGLGAISWLAFPQPFLMAQEMVKLTEQVVAPVIKPWQNVHTPTRNLVELVLAAPGAPQAPRVRVLITTETRSDHSGAIRRLQEIAAERAGQTGYSDICGWPAVERRSLVELKHVVADNHPSGGFEPGPSKTTVVTVAVAAGDFIVRYEGTLRPDVPIALAEQVVGLARRLQCSARPPAGQTQRELQMLKVTPLNWEPVAGPQAISQSEEPERGPASLSFAGASRLAPSLVVPGNGELQIAVSDDGKNVLVATNSSNALSQDGGLTFPFVAKGQWPPLLAFNGDPSVGVGATGDFYIAFLTTMPNACMASVAGSIDGGKNFIFRGHAAVCPGTGSNMCLPDQEQMAVDRKNKAAGLDQLYMVWRGFPNSNPGLLRGCGNIGGGIPTPTISCSQDSGHTWGLQTSVGTGDVGRVAVGSNGSVYVTFISGATLMINKFTPCSGGLQQEPNFPRPIASMNGVFCPVPGLDRCDSEGEASPQPAVDDTDPLHVLVAYADNTGKPNEDIIVRGSRDGGFTWPEKVTMNNNVTARRFLPWICVTKGIAYVTWYDRRSGALKPDAPDLTAYFINVAIFKPVTPGTDRSVSLVDDPQCAGNWPKSADNMDDSNGCPAGTVPIPGVCMNELGTGSRSPCSTKKICISPGETCKGTGGLPKYGDYNGNACMNGAAYVAWASGKPAPGINVYTDRLNYAFCGQKDQLCCFKGSQCKDASLACGPDNTCVTCGDFGQPCCAEGPQCHGNLACNAQKQCSCGFLNQSCCGPNATCQPGLICDINTKCVCGGANQPCCNQNNGGTCNDVSLACDHRDFFCRTTCGHQGQQCCNGAGPACNAGLVCTGGLCACGGLDQPCCDPNGTCNFGLKCAAGLCRSGTGGCAQCSQKLTLCLNRCGNDAQCQCLCRNDQCDCFQQNSCGKACILENCSN